MTGLCERITGNKIAIESITDTRQADLRIFITDNTLIEHESGWTPEKSVETIFQDIYNWIRDNEAQLKPILK